ncbi:SLC13 family permease [Halarsenatibacter silvermanii]
MPGAVQAEEPDVGAGPGEEAALDIDIIVMIAYIIIILVLFILEPIRLDLIAVLIPVGLVFLNPWTGIGSEEALSGFSNSATITVLAMFILSEGIQKSGLVQIIGDKISRITGGDEVKQIGVISSLSGTLAGFINNTPVVAIFIPMVTDLARSTNISPSKLLIPLSYASTMGGMLTLIGTATNLLASDISDRLIDRPFNMFEFTHLGVLVLITGVIYFVTIGRKLLPDHIKPEEGLVEEYEMEEFMAEVIVEKNSPLVGKSVGETLRESELDMDLMMITRGGEQFIEPLQAKSIRQGDRLVIRSSRDTLMQLMNREGLRFRADYQVSEDQLEEPPRGQKLVEVVIPNGSYFADQSLADVNFSERYDTCVMAVRRGSELSHSSLDDIVLHPGDVLLLLVNDPTLKRLRRRRDVIVAREMEKEDYRREKIPLAVAILAGVVAFGVTGIVPIVISALAGVLIMVVTGCVEPTEIYEAVNWEIIFLMAGLIPLGTAMELTGTADYIAGQFLLLAGGLPPLGILALFYLFTSLVTNVISNRGSVVMMVPVAVDAALRMGAAPFPFVLAVTFGASTAYLTPVGNQVHLMVYGPGGYDFMDYFKVGLPLQLLLAAVVSLGIFFFWGI